MATTLFHWSLHPWAIYCVVGLAIAYGVYRKGRLQLISAAFEPLIGDRANGPLGKVIDMLAIFATLFGSAASLGLGALQISSGLDIVAGLGGGGTAVLIGIIVLLSRALSHLRRVARNTYMELQTARRRVTRILGTVPVAAGALPIALFNLPTAAAAPCPDVEVVFARGTTEPPGVGGVGQAFVDALRSKVGGRSVGVYAVDYPASNDFTNSSVAGANDASAHVQSTAANCPSTKMVLGGFSQGAAVIDMATTDLPPEVADHVAATADFGGPRTVFADSLSPGPLPVVSPIFAGKSIDMCVPNDPICFEGGWDMRAHNAYVQTGMVDQAASYAAGRL